MKYLGKNNKLKYTNMFYLYANMSLTQICKEEQLKQLKGLDSKTYTERLQDLSLASVEKKKRLGGTW